MQQTARLIMLVAAMCPAAEAGKKRMNVAFVLLSAPAMPRAEDLARAYRAFAPDVEPLRVAKSQKPEILELTVPPNGTAFVLLMPVAVPKREADDAAQFSVSSLGTGWKLPSHKAHLVVTMTDPEEARALDSLSRFTALVAAVTEASRALGVYWGSASATHDPKFLTSIAREPGIAPRIMLWTGVSVAREVNGRISLLSLGMKQLELPDLLLTAPKGSETAALATFFDLLAYVAERRKPLPEGDTVGRSASEKLPVHYVPSPSDSSTKVWRVELP